MDRHAVALTLEEIATLLDATDENRFKVRAFRTAARTVDRTDRDLPALVASGTLGSLPGIGPATARIIEELVTTGESRYLTDLRERAPSGMRAMLRVPGIGPKKIHLLHEQLGVTDLDSLEAAARAGRIAGVRGFGEHTQQRILEGLGFARAVAGRRRLHQAQEAAARVAGLITALPGVREAAVAGELRRGLEIVDGIVFVVVTDAPAADLMRTLRATSSLPWIEGGASVLRATFGDGLPAEIRITGSAGAGAALLDATGNAAHVGALRRAAADRDLRLDADGLHPTDAADASAHTSVHETQTAEQGEAAVYAALGMAWVPPELRDGLAELDAARAGTLPRLLRLEDLRGCFHCHTTYSDGKATLQEMAAGAIALGWDYLGIADHSRNAGYAGGLSTGQIRRQQREIARWNAERGDELWLFSGIEADILQDGRLDYAAQGQDAVLESFDYVIGSVHSHFRMDRRAMTARLSRAASDARLTILGHATGRLLLLRDGYEIDMDVVIQHAADGGAAIEINADPHRLDMSWQHWPLARRLGVRCAINPDAHSVAGMQNVLYGVTIARRAWLTPADVINAWSRADVFAYLDEKKRRRAEAH